ncbi:MAG: hypothetical protein KDA52_08120 [Planctomycetaceae bacterium]|nr:hypothetical protein [Planctomycetaceae bacterium]
MIHKWIMRKYTDQGAGRSIPACSLFLLVVASFKLKDRICGIEGELALPGFVMSAEVQQDRPWDAIPRWPRRLLSAWLLYHVIAIVMPPLAIPPTSSLLSEMAGLFRPYTEGLHLNHGYHYFAPQPGESTLIEFTAIRSDGTEVKGIMPNRQIWPRLLYHRHFMLTESLGYIPDELQDDWLKSYARCISRKTHCPEVELTHLLHYMPTTDMVNRGVTLDNPGSFDRTVMGVYQRENK